MEYWNMGFFFIALKNIVIHEKKKLIMDRKNINRGFKKLRIWQDAIALYVLTYKTFSKFPSIGRLLSRENRRHGKKMFFIFFSCRESQSALTHLIGGA